MTEIFVRGTRDRVRFSSNKGLLTIEDLWAVPFKKPAHSNVTDIDDIAKKLSRQLKETEVESFVDDSISTKENTLLKLKFDIVKYVIKVRKAEREAAEKQKSNESQIRKYDAIIARKEDEKLDDTDIEDIKKMRDALKN